MKINEKVPFSFEEKEEKFVLDRITPNGEKNDSYENSYEKKDPKEKIFLKMNEIRTVMEKKGLENDVKIIDKFKTRFEHYIKSANQGKNRLREKLNRDPLMSELLDIKNRKSGGVSRLIPISSICNENGGFVYDENGYRSSGSFCTTAESLDEELKKLPDTGLKREIINYDFSEEGKKIFMKRLGILKEGENPEQIVEFLQEEIGKRESGYAKETTFSKDDFRVEIATNIGDNVSLNVWKFDLNPSNSTFKPNENKQVYEEICLKISDEFLEKILKSKT